MSQKKNNPKTPKVEAIPVPRHRAQEAPAIYALRVLEKSEPKTSGVEGEVPRLADILKETEYAISIFSSSELAELSLYNRNGKP